MLPLTEIQIISKPAGNLVVAVRERHGFTQLQCAAIVAVTTRSWITYETSDGKMPLSTWWLFLLRIGEIHEGHLLPIPPRQRAGAMIHLKPA